MYVVKMQATNEYISKVNISWKKVWQIKALLDFTCMSETDSLD